MAPPQLSRVGLWTGVFDHVTSVEAKRLAQVIEESGFGALWIPEAVGRDILLTAAQLLDATTTITVATGVANIYARDALTMGNSVRTLEEAFPGRFLLGLGVSHQHAVEGIRRHDYTKPYSAMVTYLDAMADAMFFGVGPEAVPAPVLAALGPRMLELAGTRAAGAHTYFVPVDHTLAARAILGAEPLLAPELMVVLGTDLDDARAVARKAMGPYLKLPNYVNNLFRFGFYESDVADGGSDRLVDAIVACGDEELIVRRVQEHLDAGADHVAVQVLGRSIREVPEAGWRDLGAAFAEQAW